MTVLRSRMVSQNSNTCNATRISSHVPLTEEIIWWRTVTAYVINDTNKHQQRTLQDGDIVYLRASDSPCFGWPTYPGTLQSSRRRRRRRRHVISILNHFLISISVLPRQHAITVYLVCPCRPTTHPVRLSNCPCDILNTIYSCNLVQLVEAPCYERECWGFDSRWGLFSLTWSFRAHYGPEVDSASKVPRYFLGVTVAGA
jgi:hypothetical protein